MPKETVKDLLRQFREMNGLRVIFSGAETLLHPDLMELLRYARQLDFMLFLHTNLIILNESQAQELSDLNMFNVQVSLYSDKAEVHDSITGKQGSYLRTVRGLEMLARYHVPVTISCPIMRQNITTIEGVKAYADQLGFGCYFDEIMMAQHNGDSRNLSVRISKEEMPNLIERLIRLRPEFMQSICESESEDELLSKKFARRMTACNILSSSMCIDSDGTAYPCAGWNGMRLGNVNSSSLEELWQNGNNVELLRKTKTSEFVKCRNCDFHNFCDMCPVYNYNENGDRLSLVLCFVKKPV
jgi:radical SAM additional 4Fe4S-binding domain